MSKFAKKTVELKPSKIRRDPVRANPAAGPTGKAWFQSSEWETWIVVSGVVVFALALTALTFGAGEVVGF